MKLVSIETIPGQEFEALDIVRGTVVYSKNFGRDFMAGMKTLVGGEITGYTPRCWWRPGRSPPSAWWTRQRLWEPTQWWACGTPLPP